MRKFGIVGAVIALILILAVGVFAYQKMAGSKKVTPSSTATMQVEKKESPFTSISDALSKNLSLKCEYPDLGGKKAVSYLKNGMIRVDMTGKTPEENASLILRDNKMYFWTAQMAIVNSFNMEEVSKQVREATPSSQQQNPQDYVSMMDKYRDACKVAGVADTQFVIPTNVKFQDISAMTKGIAPSVPAGAKVTVAPSVNYQELLKQYQNAR